MRKYCEECEKEVETRIVVKKETYEVFGEAIDVDAQVLVCAECGGELFCEELDNATLIKVYDVYRQRHKLLFPSEIKKIREQYGLSQRSFAKLLNWGDKTIFRYENGSIQDRAHNSLLVFLREPENMRTYLMENEVDLTPKQLEKLFETIDKLEHDKELYTGRRLLHVFFSRKPCENNGFRSFDYEKFYAMVLFFANKNEELLKTKLMKLLNYSDMIFFKENGISISGTSYVHLPYGPVPENIDFLFGAMAADHIAHIEVFFDNGYERHQVIPDEEFPRGILSDAEIAVLERVYKKFVGYGSVEISKYSHQERGYKETKQGEIISYLYAKDISNFDMRKAN